MKDSCSRKDDTDAMRRFKRDAKRIKRERGVSHSEALEILAELSGFMDYEQAKRALNEGADQ